MLGHGKLWARGEFPAGRCIACDVKLGPRRGNDGKKVPGSVRKILCGTVECGRTYNALWKSRVAELVALGLAAEGRVRK